ncbi:MAG TPA: flavin reductase family protein [Spirochaetota bacterium]|nr:flavin reductase family protein [Spirochaetota bacterium]HPS85858.1 flavin reductase family protein [Spirochaetota bacterium]
MKVVLKEKNALYPLPVALIGTEIDGKPNFITIAHLGIGAMDMVTLGMNKAHYSNQGIITNREFSINIPSCDMATETDYIGMVSGSAIDKSGVFKIFRGLLKHAPMIENAPVTMECTLVDHYDYKTHDLFVGKVEKIYAEENILTNGTIDVAKVRPMLFDMHQRKYWKIGEPFADAWSIGKKYSR